MKTSTPRFGLETWVESGEHANAGAIAYVGTRASTTSLGVPGLEYLQSAEAKVVAVWSPEHGYDGTVEHGEAVADGTGKPVPQWSLYGRRTAPTAEMLAEIDTVVYDLQDVGARYYTFWHVLKRTLEAASRAGKRYVVCDRPNPLGAERQGNVLGAEADKDVGCWPMAMQHGLVAGDCVSYWAEAHAGLEWHRAAISGWTRTQAWSELGVPWTPPSPNLPTVESVFAYPGTCLWEGLNVSVGRGTDLPFQWIGAPWLEAERLAAAVEEVAVDWHVECPTRTPSRSPYEGEVCSGVQFTPTSPNADPVRMSLIVMRCLLKLASDHLVFHESHFDALAGGGLRQALRNGAPLGEILDPWHEQRRKASLQPSSHYTS